VALALLPHADVAASGPEGLRLVHMAGVSEFLIRYVELILVTETSCT
jgi:hypothetical protein